MSKTIEFTLHPKQMQFLEACKTHTITGLITGQGFGKTTAGMYQALISALMQPCSGMIVAPTYNMLVQVVLPIFNKIMPKGLVVESNKAEGWYKLRNSSVIWLRSGDRPEKLDGSNLQWVWLDEAKIFSTDDVFRILIGRVGRDARGGKLWITSTPLGINHWLYKLFVENPPPNTTYITGSTKDNIFLPAMYYDSLKATYTGVYAEQQLEGRFVSFEGLVYDTFSLHENVADVKYNPDLPILWGIDDGYAHGDGEGSAGYHPRVILICQQHADGAVHVLAEYVATLELPEVSINNVLKLSPAPPMVAYIDSSASELKRRLHDIGINTVSSTHRVAEGIKVVRRYVQDGNGNRLLKIHPACKRTIREFQMYRYSDNGRGISGEPAPVKQDDHCMDALRYLLYKLR